MDKLEYYKSLYYRVFNTRAVTVRGNVGLLKILGHIIQNHPTMSFETTPLETSPRGAAQHRQLRTYSDPLPLLSHTPGVERATTIFFLRERLKPGSAGLLI
jgi:hypothetical protein